MEPASTSNAGTRWTPHVVAAITLFAMIFALQGCAVEWAREHPLYCRVSEPAEKTLIRDSLYFGSSIPGGGEVGAGDWANFETDVIAHEFPQGFTVIESHGTWRGEDGNTVREPGHLVVLVHADDAASDAAVRSIIARYRTMFRQQSVLRERTIACVTL
jgi:hypothetical protein